MNQPKQGYQLIGSPLHELAVFVSDDPAKLAYLYSYYQDLVKSHIGKRQLTAPTFESLLQNDGQLPKEYLEQYGHIKKYAHAINLAELFRDRLYQVRGLSPTEWNEERLQAEIKKLSMDERSHIHQFKRVYHRLPLLFILYRILMRQKGKRDVSVFIRRYGIDGDLPLDTKALAERIDRTTTTVLNILRETISAFAPKYLPYVSLMDYGELFTRPYIFLNDPDYQRSLKEELPQLSLFAGAGLVSLVNSFRIQSIKNINYLVDPKIIHREAIVRGFRKAKSVLGLKFTGPDQLPISKFLPGVPSDHLPYNEEVLSLLITAYYRATIKEAKLVIRTEPLQPTRKEILYKILRKNKSPMYIGEILKVIRRDYPNQAMQTEEQVRIQVRADKRIRPVGRNSRYGLKEWKHVPFCPILDFIVSVLKEANKPMKADDLIIRIQEHYPQSNLHSLLSLIYLDKKNRIKRFIGCYLGLSGVDYGPEFIPTSRKSYDFNERKLASLERYLSETGKYPTANQDKSIYNWLRKIRRKEDSFTPDQRARYEEIVKRYEAMGIRQLYREDILPQTDLKTN